MKTLALLLLLAACCFAAPGARAANESCTVTTTNVAFGVYDPTSATPLDTQGNVAVDCAGGAVVVTIGLGPGGSGSYANRRMTNALSDNLYYELYLDAGRATKFGDGTNGTSSVMCTTGSATSGNGCTGGNPPGRGRYTEHVIYGRLPASQNAAAGSYSDTVMYIVTF
jgi:spore coat protein U-like protein